jgi:hypothetical protein
VQEGISSGKNPIKIELEIKKNKELSLGYPHVLEMVRAETNLLEHSRLEIF